MDLAASIGDLVIVRYVDIAELERPDDLLGRGGPTAENPIEGRAVDALPSRPGRLTSRSFYFRTK